MSSLSGANQQLSETLTVRPAEVCCEQRVRIPMSTFRNPSWHSLKTTSVTRCIPLPLGGSELSRARNEQTCDGTFTLVPIRTKSSATASESDGPWSIADSGCCEGFRSGDLLYSPSLIFRPQVQVVPCGSRVFADLSQSELGRNGCRSVVVSIWQQ